MKVKERLAAASGLYIIPKFIAAVAGLFLLPIYTQYLSPEEYGILSLLAVITIFASLLSNLHLESGLYRYQAHFKTNNERKDFLGTLYISRLLLSLFIAFLSLCFFGLIYYLGFGFNKIPFFPFIVATSLTVFFASMSLFQLQIWISEEFPIANALIVQ